MKNCQEIKIIIHLVKFSFPRFYELRNKTSLSSAVARTEENINNR